MKSIIAVCGLRDMVIEKFGNSTWELVLERSGLPKDTVFLPTENAPDELVMKVANNLCAVLEITIEQAADAFGEYWMKSYAPKVYHNLHILVPSSRDFLLRLNDIHNKVKKALEGTQVPYFNYDWQDANTLIMTCESIRHMPFFIGLVRGVGRYFEESLAVNMWSSTQILIEFPQSELWQE
jgi:hypothetical protein